MRSSSPKTRISRPTAAAAPGHLDFERAVPVVRTQIGERDA